MKYIKNYLYKNVDINLEEKKEKKYYGYRKNKRKNFRER